jgi:O-antigen/teichoic acid export membrane protein
MSIRERQLNIQPEVLVMTIRRKLSGFAGNVATLLTGATLSQGIRLLLTPVVARLFVPEHFGVAALFLSIATIISMGSTLRYDQAIILPKEDSEALGIMSLSLIILLTLSSLVFVLVLLLSLWAPDFSWIRSIGKWGYALPIAVFLLGLASVLTTWNMRNKRFRTMAGSEITKGCVTPGSRICLGALHGSSVSGLILGIFLGLLSRIGVLLTNVKKHHVKPMINVKRLQMLTLAKKYKDFPLYYAPTDLLRNFARNLPVLMLGLMFSSNIVGFYALANRLVRMPIDLVSESVRRVYLQKTSELKNRGSFLKVLLIRTTVWLAILGLPPFLTIFFLGEWIFAFILGAEWSAAGRYASILAPFFFAVFINAPSSAILIVLRKQALLFRIQACLLICTGAVFLGCYLTAASPEQTLHLFSSINVLFMLGTMTIAIKVTIYEDRRLETKHLARHMT